MSSDFVAHVRSFLSGRRRVAAKAGDTTKTSKAPSFLRFRSSSVFITFTVCLAIFTDILFYGLIVPVIPFSLSVQAGVPEDQVQHWTAILLACHNAALFVASPIVGIVADRTSSRRLPLLLGLVALAASTLLLCLGNSIALLVLGRLLQGLSAAIVWSVGLALLVDTMGRNVGYSMGYVGHCHVAFAVIVCDIVLRLVLIEKKVARQWLDDSDDETSGQEGHTTDEQQYGRPEEQNHNSGPGGVVAASTDPEKQSAPDDGSASPDQPDQGIISEPSSRPVADILAHPVAATHPHWKLLKSSRVIALLLSVVIEAVILFSFDTVAPLFVKDLFHWNSISAGLLFISVMIPGFASPVVGKLADRYGAKWPTVIGFAASVPLLICLRFVDENTIQDKVLLCALLALLGFTLLTLVNTPLIAEITYAINAKEVEQPGVWSEKGVYGTTYGLWTTAYALGGTIGSLMAGYLNAGPGWGTTTWSLAVWSALGALVSLALGPRQKKPDAAATPTTTETSSTSLGREPV
ncbi:major facilitator superfamily domain-containing protein [Bombardia bombarda]|uniref:Major facilitator superfamily domain-containing protein n=1 Tax=Bombardia bombarda TaxID=252184 RepID=A0AA39XJG7_9PEZI|nr:major facilitator superfamily domain-containing protein [Bombardia bombarda]